MTGYLGQDQIDALFQRKKEKKFSPDIENKDDRLQALPEREAERKPLVERVEFAQLQPPQRISPTKPDHRFCNSIPLLISGELGTAEITVRELLKLEEGSIVKLNKMVGESSALLVNEQYLGQAEVMIINDRFGMRVTTIGLEEVAINEEEKQDMKAKRKEKIPGRPPTIKEAVNFQEEKE